MMRILLQWLFGAGPVAAAFRFGTAHLAICLGVIAADRILGADLYAVIWIVDFPVVSVMATFATGAEPSFLSMYGELLMLAMGTLMWGSIGVFLQLKVGAWIGRRRFPVGHCRCGYNLEGNESGRCPECGSEVDGDDEKVES